jgi:hypothetical protein
MTPNPIESDRQAVEQQQMAHGLRLLGTELGTAAERAIPAPESAPDLVTDLTRQAATSAQGLAEWLEQRDPSTVLDELLAFAQQRPETFLAITLGAALLRAPVEDVWAAPLEASPAFAVPVGEDGIEPTTPVDNSPYAGDTAYVDDPAGVEPPFPAPAVVYRTDETG